MPRRFRKGLNVREITGLVFVTIIGLRLLVGYATHDPYKDRVEKFYEGSVEIKRVVDGDTIIIRQRDRNDNQLPNPPTYEARLRLIGIDTPETVKPDHPIEPFGPEASQFTKEFLSRGAARLRLDRRRKDYYNRLLGYIYVGDEMLNIEIVRAGLARVSSYPGDNQSIERKLRKAEDEARQAKMGIWSGSGQLVTESVD